MLGVLGKSRMGMGSRTIVMETLQKFRAATKGARVDTVGLSDAAIQRVIKSDPHVTIAVEEAARVHASVAKDFADILAMDESEACAKVQSDFLQFYDQNAVSPYIPLAASGSWIVTAHGALLLDTGGYGMIGYGHNPSSAMSALAKPQVMCNIMTPNFAQVRFAEAMHKEVGHTRDGGVCPYEKFACLNSGSESVTLAMRIADADARQMTSSDGPHAGRDSVLVSLEGSFHGRTERPAMASDSSHAVYEKHLATFKQGVTSDLYTVRPNDVEHLRQVFKEIDDKGLHVELMLMEPVMGEGNPGQGITREFYDEARRLTDDYRSLLLVDSIQAGLRAHGTLSIMDYPGFQDASPPDFETYSKALNAGQFPLSILALGPRVSPIYVRGLYGNTMTTNPRALDIATAVLGELKPEARANIVEMGNYFKQSLEKLKTKYPGVVDSVSGTGLLVACHINPKYSAYGKSTSLEVVCRKRGLVVIHGGKNALRFTPSFMVTTEQIDLITEVLDSAMSEL